MLVRLRDFAEINRISERTVQVHIKNNQEELEGHIDRRGKQGTWLDEFAVNFLLDRIQLPTKDEVLVPTPREAALLEQLSAANRMLADAERRAGENAEAAGKVKFLEAAKDAQDAQINDLSVEVGKLTEKAARATEDAQKARDELAAVRRELGDEQGKNINLTMTAAEAMARERSMKDYTVALDAWYTLGWLKRKRTPKPVMPELPEED